MSDFEITQEAFKEASYYKDLELEKMRGQLNAIAEESNAVGFLQKIRIDDTYNKLMKFMMLYKVKKSKEYSKAGKTWDAFCTDLGMSSRTVDENLADLRPVFEEFSADFAEIFSMPFNKVRYLGKAISADSAEIKNGEIVFEDTRIAITPDNKDDIIALIDEIKDSHQRETEALKDQVAAQKKVSEAKQKTIDRMEEAEARYRYEQETKGFVPGEEEFIKSVERQLMVFQGTCLAISPERNIVPEDATPVMVAKYLSALFEIRRIAAAMYDGAIEKYGHPGIETEEAWRPPEIDLEPRECKQCKAAHPHCNECCELCDDTCNGEQKCVMSPPPKAKPEKKNPDDKDAGGAIPFPGKKS